MDDVRPAGLYTRRAALMLLSATLSKGETKMGQPVVHFEIGCRDRAKTADFFSNLFGWKMQSSGPATNIEPAEQ